MDTATRVQILDKTDCISHSTNTLGKGVNPIILPPAMGKYPARAEGLINRIVELLLTQIHFDLFLSENVHSLLSIMHFISNRFPEIKRMFVQIYWVKNFHLSPIDIISSSHIRQDVNIFFLSYNDKLIQRILHSHNLSLYFKLTITAILHCTNFNYLY